MQYTVRIILFFLLNVMILLPFQIFKILTISQNNNQVRDFYSVFLFYCLIMSKTCHREAVHTETKRTDNLRLQYVVLSNKASHHDSPFRVTDSYWNRFPLPFKYSCVYSILCLNHLKIYVQKCLSTNISHWENGNERICSFDHEFISETCIENPWLLLLCCQVEQQSLFLLKTLDFDLDGLSKYRLLFCFPPSPYIVY